MTLLAKRALATTRWPAWSAARTSSKPMPRAAPVINQTGEVLGAALFSEMFVLPQRPMNAARFAFLDPWARTLYRDWAGNARQIVALLRAGRAPYDGILTDLVSELATRSDEFHTLWAFHEVRVYRHYLDADLSPGRSTWNNRSSLKLSR